MITRPRTFLLYTILVFAVALAARGFNLWDSAPMKLGPDEAEYVALGEGLARNGNFVSTEATQTIFQGGKVGEPTAYRNPALPLFIAIHYKLFGYDLLWPRVTLVLLSSVVCVFLALLGKMIGHPTAGLIAAALWAINPPGVIGPYSADRPISESLAVFLLTGAITWLVLYYQQPRLRNVVISAVLLGLAILTRGYLVFLLPMCAAFLYFFPAGKRWQALISFTVIASAIVGLWVCRNWIRMEKPVLATQTEGFYLGNNLWSRGSISGEIFTQTTESPQFKEIKERYPHVMEMSEIERSEMWTREAVRSILAFPKQFVWLLMRKTLIFWGPFQFWSRGWYRWHYLFSVMVVFAFAGLARKWPAHSAKFILLLLLPITAVFIATLMTFVLDRYRFMIEPFVFLLGAIGVERVVERSRRAESQ